MSEEEKEAINNLRFYSTNVGFSKYDGTTCVLRAKDVQIVLNLIGKQYAELNSLKEIEQLHKEENGLLRQELDMQIEHNKELEEHQKQYLDGELITAKQGKFFEKMIKENYIRKDKIKEIVDEHIPKQPNIITGKIEYAPNTNANSFLVQDILELLEMN